MKFDHKEKILRLTAEELVSTASARLGHDFSEGFPLALPSLSSDGEEKNTTSAFAIPAFSAEVSARAALRVTDDGIVLSRRFRSLVSNAEGKKSQTRLLRALGFVLCYAFANGQRVSFCFYVEEGDGNVSTLCEAPDAPSLEKFFARLLTALVKDAAHEMERVTLRLPSFLSVAFPYPDVREGQRI